MEDYITLDGKINWSQAQKFISRLAEHELNLMPKKVNRMAATLKKVELGREGYKEEVKLKDGETREKIMRENREKKLEELKKKGEDKAYKIKLLKDENPAFDPEKEEVPELQAEDIQEKDLPKIKFREIEQQREEEYKDEDSSEYRLHAI